MAAVVAHGTNTILAPAGVYSLTHDKQPLDALGTTLTIKGVGGQAIVDGGGSGTDAQAFYVFSGGHLILEHVSVRDSVGPPDADNRDRGAGSGLRTGARW